LLVLVAAGLTSASAADHGKITGRVSLKDATGQVVYGDWVRVFLVTEAIDIPRLDLADADAPVERASRINSAHMTFFIQFREQMGRDGYLVDDKLTRPDGTVVFGQVPPGRYYLVVTFPTLIAGQKGAWQVPVDVSPGQTAQVDLNAANMALRGDYNPSQNKD
jgi:hypothetical protein